MPKNPRRKRTNDQPVVELTHRLRRIPQTLGTTAGAALAARVRESPSAGCIDGIVCRFLLVGEAAVRDQIVAVTNPPHEANNMARKRSLGNDPIVRVKKCAKDPQGVLVKTKPPGRSPRWRRLSQRQFSERLRYVDQ